MSTVDTALLWAAVAGVCLLVLRLRWGAWLILPAAVRFLVWPALTGLAPSLPVWVLIILVLLAPVIFAILFLRGGQAVLTGIFGNDVAVRVVAHGLISLLGSVFGGFGRGRVRPVPDPVLPRPHGAPLRPEDFGGGR